jgi:hypothetical protein
MWAPMTRETPSESPGSTHQSGCQRPPYPGGRVAHRVGAAWGGTLAVRCVSAAWGGASAVCCVNATWGGASARLALWIRRLYWLQWVCWH